MSKRVNNAVRYKYPLPIHPLDLPQLIVHNPISWAIWLYKYVEGSNALTTKIPIVVTTSDKYPRIEVRDAHDMMYLWDNGFFGTGQLSRSEPTWYDRKQVELYKEETGGKSSMSLEQVTKSRRRQRLEFKQQREKVEAELLALRQQGAITPEEEAAILQREREKLRAFKESHTKLNSAEEDETTVDENIFDDEGNLRRLEALELMPVEAMFLSYALPVLDMNPRDLISTLHQGDLTTYTSSLDRLLMQYAAYHHYRSHGWCVRSGIKFGCDYILYKRGPPFQHAEFCVMVLDADDSRPYTWYSTVARVAGGASKTLVLCYVSKTVSPEKTMQWLRDGDLTSVFSSLEVGEVIYRRWVPGRNRD